VVDELSGLCDLWDEAGNAVAMMGGPAAGAASDAMHSSEQRTFYAALLQRASQLIGDLGGGSLTILGLLRQAAHQPANAASSAPAAAGSGDDASRATFSIHDFATRPAAQRARIEALVARGISIDEGVLAKLGISPPGVAEAADQAAPAAATAQVEMHRRSVSHKDQLMSLADGHIQLHTALRERGRRPAMQPADSLARVGAGSEMSAGRAQPATPAMTAVGQHLRLELAQVEQW